VSVVADEQRFSLARDRKTLARDGDDTRFFARGMFGSSYALSWPLRGDNVTSGAGRRRRSTRNIVLLHFIEGFGGERIRVNLWGVASLLGFGLTICAL